MPCSYLSYYRGGGGILDLTFHSLQEMMFSQFTELLLWFFALTILLIPLPYYWDVAQFLGGFIVLRLCYFPDLTRISSSTIYFFYMLVVLLSFGTSNLIIVLYYLKFAAYLTVQGVIDIVSSVQYYLIVVLDGF